MWTVEALVSSVEERCESERRNTRRSIRSGRIRSWATEMRAASIPISATQIGRILAADDVKPHRVQGWLTRRDTPEFWAQAADMCGVI